MSKIKSSSLQYWRNLNFKTEIANKTIVILMLPLSLDLDSDTKGAVFMY